MHIAYFTERPYRGLDEDVILENKGFFAVPNEHFDEVRAADDYNYYLDEYCYAEELGFDGLALNEHHGNPFCMGGVMDVEAAILARITTRAKIILIGNALANKHPLRLAEELATIDLISRGRLVSGWVRGAGSEQFFNNVNPAYNREMFEEAHDLIVQAWTRPGPWRYEGKHFHYRHVNPWVLPYQKPHPPMWIPGVLSPETIEWAAERAYPYIGLGTALGPTCDMWDMYATTAARCGYQAGPENFGYLIPTVIADTEEKAQELGKAFVYGGGQGAFSRPEHTLPPGYNSKAAIRRLSKTPGGSWLGVSREKLMEQASGASRHEAHVDFDEVRRKLRIGYDKAQDAYQLMVGTPKTVLPRIKTILEVLRPGAFIFFHVQGPVGNEDRLRSLRLMGEEIVPELREYGRQIGLTDAYEAKPGARKLDAGRPWEPVTDRRGLDRMVARV